MQIDADLYPWLSLAALAWGLLDCFFGYRVFKLTIALLGGFIGALAGQMAAVALGLDSSGELAGLLLGALLGAGLAFLLYLAAVFMAGFGFGATLTVLLLARFNHMVALLTAVVVGIVAGFVAVKLQKVLIVLATALMGAFRAIVALTFFASGMDWLYYYRHPQQIPVLVDNNPWIFPATLVLAALGAMAQFELAGSAAEGGKKKKSAKE